MHQIINEKNCSKCVITAKPTLYRNKKVGNMCIECQNDKMKHFKPNAEYKGQYFIEDKTAQLFQKELNHAQKKHGEFDIKLALAILIEEIGEVSVELQKLNEIAGEIKKSDYQKIINQKLLTKNDKIIENLKSELMQVATVCFR